MALILMETEGGLSIVAILDSDFDPREGECDISFILGLM
jgi:hypothetical protein